MANENELLALRSSNIEIEYDELLNLENSLENNLKDLIKDIEKIDLDREKLQNNEYLQESIENIVWEQVQLQLAAQIGDEFIKENNGQTLDLRKEAHIQTAENFEKGNFQPIIEMLIIKKDMLNGKITLLLIKMAKEFLKVMLVISLIKVETKVQEQFIKTIRFL